MVIIIRTSFILDFYTIGGSTKVKNSNTNDVKIQGNHEETHRITKCKKFVKLWIPDYGSDDDNCTDQQRHKSVSDSC